MNETLGAEELVLSAFLFGEFPQLLAQSVINRIRPQLIGSANSTNMAREEMESQMVKLWLRRPLRYNALGASSKKFQPGGNVFIWREKLIGNRVGEWCAPFMISHTDDEQKLT